MNIIKTPSPNHGPRAEGTRVRYVVLHHTGLNTAQSLQILCAPAAEVSAHYLITETGEIHALVPEERRAHHAGISFWKGDTDLNSLSLGIELVNEGPLGTENGKEPPFTKPQITALLWLLKDIFARYDLPATALLAHFDIAPRRKADPSRAFPWPELAEAGFGAWPTIPKKITGAERTPTFLDGNAGAWLGSLQNSLKAIGYKLSETHILDADTRAVLRAFQRRYRPADLNGKPDAETAALIRARAALEP